MISEQLTNTNINREVVANIDYKGKPKTVSGQLKGWSSDRAKLFVKLDRNYGGTGLYEGAVIDVPIAAASWSVRSYNDRPYNTR